MRRHPRFIAPQKVLLQAQDRNELRPVWIGDISKGGLYVHTDEPPALRSRVEVTVETPEGALALTAEVVHVLDPGTAAAYGQPPGVGLQFVDLDADTRRVIEHYVEGLAAGLGRGSGAPAPALGDERVLLDAMQVFLESFEGEDLYAAVGAGPSATPAEMEARMRGLERLFAQPPETLRPAQQTRLGHARKLLQKVKALLLDPMRRLDYDLRHGHVRADERVAAATPEEVEELRKVWHRTFDSRLREAERHAARALKAEQILDYAAAAREGREALVHDPFNMDLRRAIHEWEKRAAQGFGKGRGAP